MYNLLDSSEKEIKVLYCNTCMVFIQLIILFVVAIQVAPLVDDANILINNASDSLHDLRALIPKINKFIPEALNTTRNLGHMIPEIKQGMRILRQVCVQDPQCNF